MTKTRTKTDAKGAIARITTAQHVPATRVLDDAEFAIGKVAHQGDVYVHRVQDDHARGTLLGSRKLAIGEGVGSQHFAEGDVQVFAGTTAPEWAPDALLGPVVVARKPWRVTHPVHAEFVLPAGTYQVTHQLDWDHRARVVD